MLEATRAYGLQITPKPKRYMILVSAATVRQKTTRESGIPAQRMGIRLQSGRPTKVLFVPKNDA